MSTITTRNSHHSDDQTERSIGRTWKDYKSTESQCSRDILAGYYTKKMVVPLAERISFTLPINAGLQMDDLVQEGTIVLLNLIKKYDQSRNIKFEAYAYRRVRGGMIDALRRYDWVPRSVRNRFSRSERIRQKTITEQGVYPTEEQIIQSLEPTETKDLSVGQRLRPPKTFSLFSLLYHKNDEAGELLEKIEDKTPYDKSPSRINGEDSLRELTQGLRKEDRLILMLYCCEGLNQVEIAKVLGLSQSRISQKITNVIRIIKQKIKDDSTLREDFLAS